MKLSATFASLLALAVLAPLTPAWGGSVRVSPLEYGIHTLRADGALLREIHELGADWVVQLFSWREIARWRGEYNWEYPDAVVRGAGFYGLKLAVRLDQQPRWARSDPVQNGPPDDLTDYGDFVQAVAERYRGQVSAYIIWNEPNLAVEWGNARPDAQAYVEMLKVAYGRIKQAAPDCLVVSAGLAPTNHHDAAAVDDRLFLRAMYEAGGGAYFDVLGTHPYGFAYGPHDPQGAHDGLNFARLLDLRGIMVEYGDEQKPVWATEFGWTVSDAWHAVTPDEQAHYLLEALRRAKQEWPWLTMVAVWHLARGSVPDDQQGYNLVDDEGTPRPAYSALQVAWQKEPRTAVGSAPPVAGTSSHLRQRAEVLREDVVLHLGDSELPPPWVPLWQGQNPAAEWKADFYVGTVRSRDWTLYAELMQPNERGSHFSINGHRLAPDLPVEDYSRTWVAHSWPVPAAYLRPGLNHLELAVGMDIPDYQQEGYTWDDLQIRNIFLQEQ